MVEVDRARYMIGIQSGGHSQHMGHDGMGTDGFLDLSVLTPDHLRYGTSVLIYLEWTRPTDRLLKPTTIHAKPQRVSE